MKTNKKISIIGGGISGCVCAFLLSNLGYKVKLFEKKNKLGGSIEDIHRNDDIFLNGPQYFEANSDWLKKIRKLKLFKNQFQDFEGSYLNDKGKKINIYKSYIDLFGKKEIHELFAQPTTKIKFKKLENRKKIILLNERLASYQNNIKIPVEAWCKNFSRLYKNLHSSCAEFLNVTRINFSEDTKAIAELKKKSKLADKLLGIPKISDGRKFAIAKNGNDFFFKTFAAFLKKKVEIKFNSKIKVLKDNNRDIKIMNDKKLVNSDYIIWTANPVPLLLDLGYGNLENPVVRTKIYCANIKFLKKYEVDNFYIQVFSNKSNIYRIFFYKLKNKAKITIETFMSHDNMKIDLSFINEMLALFSIKIKFLNSFVEKKEIRHVLITKNDYNKFMKFNDDLKETNLISSAWHIFNRDRKIDFIMKKFNR